MEDTATAEICRAQLWQWIRMGATLSDGTPVTTEAFAAWIGEAVSQMLAEPGGRDPERRFVEAGQLFAEMCTSDTLTPFLTLQAYPRLVTPEEA